MDLLFLSTLKHSTEATWSRVGNKRRRSSEQDCTDLKLCRLEIPSLASTKRVNLPFFLPIHFNQWVGTVEWLSSGWPSFPDSHQPSTHGHGRRKICIIVMQIKTQRLRKKNMLRVKSYEAILVPCGRGNKKNLNHDEKVLLTCSWQYAAGWKGPPGFMDMTTIWWNCCNGCQHSGRERFTGGKKLKNV